MFHVCRKSGSRLLMNYNNKVIELKLHNNKVIVLKLHYNRVIVLKLQQDVEH